MKTYKGINGVIQKLRNTKNSTRIAFLIMAGLSTATLVKCESEATQTPIQDSELEMYKKNHEKVIQERIARLEEETQNYDIEEPRTVDVDRYGVEIVKEKEKEDDWER